MFSIVYLEIILTVLSISLAVLLETEVSVVTLAKVVTNNFKGGGWDSRDATFKNKFKGTHLRVKALHLLLGNCFN